MGVADHRVGDVTHKRPHQPTEPHAAYRDKAGLKLLCQSDDLRVRFSLPDVRLVDDATELCDTLDPLI